jgi:uncharacterized membrane protein
MISRNRFSTAEQHTMLLDDKPPSVVDSSSPQKNSRQAIAADCVATIFFTVANNVCSAEVGFEMPAFPSFLNYFPSLCMAALMMAVSRIAGEEPLVTLSADWRRANPGMAWKHHKQYLIMSVITVINWLAFQTSAAWVDGNLQQVLAATTPVFCYFFAVCLLGTRLTTREAICSCVVIIGAPWELPNFFELPNPLPRWQFCLAYQIFRAWSICPVVRTEPCTGCAGIVVASLPALRKTAAGETVAGHEPWYNSWYFIAVFLSSTVCVAWQQVWQEHVFDLQLGITAATCVFWCKPGLARGVYGSARGAVNLKDGCMVALYPPRILFFT